MKLINYVFDVPGALYMGTRRQQELVAWFFARNFKDAMGM